MQVWLDFLGNTKNKIRPVSHHNIDLLYMCNSSFTLYQFWELTFYILWIFG